MTLSRRRLLAGGAASVAATGAAGAAAWAGYAHGENAPPAGAEAVAFHGPHQAGVLTPAQDRLHFAAFDVITQQRGDLVDLLRAWTAAAARMTAGRDAGPLGAVQGPPQAPPDDTGEALDLPPAALTLTIGFGPTLFRDATGTDRFDLADRRPAALADLPRFPGDALQPEISDGDLCVQACANDPQVATHAIRNLARVGFGAVSLRWSQLGFGRTSSLTAGRATPRNLFGFKDGTANLRADNTAAVREQLWVPPGDGPDWMTGGTYLVTRKIAMTIETWDRTPLSDQEAIIGRTKATGAPLGRPGEFDPIDLAHRHDGEPAIPADAHVRLTHPDSNAGAMLLRRGYNYVDGSDPLGHLAAGLFFMAYQRDPRRQFTAIQQRLATQDAMNQYIRHLSSGLYACPPGVRTPDGFWGQSLFA